jgi:CDP-diacylglycerol--glycerol-3-phosphate 3-phosphatidyltransferase
MSERAEAANIITCARIVMSVALLFVPALSPAFYVLYLVAGFTDIIDGEVARRTGTTSTFGAKLDSVADLTFYSVSLIRMMPWLRKRLPGWIWYVVFAVLALRLSAYLVAAFRLHRFAAVHTIANKATGAMVFGVGPMLLLPWLTPYCLVLAAVATYSSAEELIMHLKETPPQK